MATAIITSKNECTRTLKLAHTAQVADGDVIVSNGQALVAIGAAAANAASIYAFRGRGIFPKYNNLAMAVGDVVYWVAASGYLNKTSSSNTKTGIVVEAAGTTDTTVVVEFGENK